VHTIEIKNQACCGTLTVEEVLLDAFRRLPPAAAEELAALVRRLAALAPNTAIDWSDSWSDSDLQEFTAASARSVEAAESEDSH